MGRKGAFHATEMMVRRYRPDGNLCLHHSTRRRSARDMRGYGKLVVLFPNPIVGATRDSVNGTWVGSFGDTDEYHWMVLSSTSQTEAGGTVGPMQEVHHWADGWTITRFHKVGGWTFLLKLREGKGKVHLLTGSRYRKDVQCEKLTS